MDDKSESIDKRGELEDKINMSSDEDIKVTIINN
jgi:hypothetical protein